MRDPERLDEFYDELKYLHRKYVPDWRFGQFMNNFLSWLMSEKGIDPFFPEESKMLDYVREYIKGTALPQEDGKNDAPYKQIIIVRKDLDMTKGKMAAQVSHASMAFMTCMARRGAIKMLNGSYETVMTFDKGLYEKWIEGAFTKCVLEAKNKNDILKAAKMADNIGMKEGVDYFMIYDNCYTELTPEEQDGTCLTCIGFKPMSADTIDVIGKKYQLYKD